ncbi:MAG: bifunctional folylpolyglutamate synthase/dihydrofolate synthase [Bacillus thermozeamaize]|uniref:Dihydrofolate synthase/folylpolyglutamate synthase n=1 Tax=Bacillus thermozeamaize TaxID=230954 RepID=A0A1Y3PM50_9BACI|nr:MAG: bifunctional folylpolyglutamate synthase/dihydrofolate synthase [Bacillus thermozeamaize]
MRHFSAGEEVLAWIRDVANPGIKPGLHRMEWLMERLGHPERRLKFIHIAGTNGKGSTAAMIANTLYTCGYDVGLFTSPYVENFSERIRFNGQPIPEADLIEAANQIRPAVEECGQTEWGAPSEFELVTTLAIWYYAHISYPYYVVWETGLGGRWDATNVVYPVLTIITTVGLDHTQYLGETIAEIAREKAGIIKPGVPLVCGVTDPEALDVIQQVATEKKASLYVYGRHFTATPVEASEDGQSFDFSGPYRRFERVQIRLAGPHQMQNAAVALMGLEVLRQFMAFVYEEDEVLYRGMSETRWPGRLEKLADRPGIVIDGAHNPQAAASIAEAIRQLYTYDRLHLVVGLLKDKVNQDFFRPLLPLVDTVILTEPDFPRKASAEQLKEMVATLRPDVETVVEEDWRNALEAARRLAGPGDMVLVTGSLYLIGDVRKWLKNR